MRRNSNGRLSDRRATGRLIEPMESRLMFSTVWVTNTNDSGTGSLRAAIEQADSLKGKETIDFAIGKGAHTIEPLSALPSVTTPVTINGTTQPGYSSKPLIVLDGVHAGKANGIEITDGGTTIKGLVINNFQGDGILAEVNGSNTIQGDYIGTDLTGSIKEPNNDGVLLGGGGNIIGGVKASQRNVISGNANTGLDLVGPSTGKNIIQGNYIGVNAAGTAALANTNNGIDIQSESHNTIGGTASGARNVISGNGQDGILLYGTSDYNTIQGNLVGTDVTGKVGIGNGQNGIEDQTSYNLIGGPTAAARNVLSDNEGSGVICWGWISTSVHNLIIGNYVGTDITGTKALGNWGGVVFSNNANDNVAGGTSAADRNLISGNTHVGVGFYEASLGNLVEGNYVGTDVTGNNAIANREGVGIFNSSIDNTIGGLATGAGNLISGNTNDGVDIFSNDTTVEGNILGMNASDKKSIPNKGANLLEVGSSGDTVLDNL